MHSSLLSLTSLLGLTSSALANPFDNGELFVNPLYSEKLQQTHDYFSSKGDQARVTIVKAIQEKV